MSLAQAESITTWRRKNSGVHVRDLHSIHEFAAGDDGTQGRARWAHDVEREAYLCAVRSANGSRRGNVRLCLVRIARNVFYSSAQRGST